jgi:hypothetical protein
MAKKLSDILEYQQSSDVWIPSGYDLAHGWEWVADSDTPIRWDDSGQNDIPDTRWFSGVVTNGREKIRCVKKVYWHGGPNSGYWFWSFYEALPVEGEV